MNFCANFRIYPMFFRFVFLRNICSIIGFQTRTTIRCRPNEESSRNYPPPRHHPPRRTRGHTKNCLAVKDSASTRQSLRRSWGGSCRFPRDVYFSRDRILRHKHREARHLLPGIRHGPSSNSHDTDHHVCNEYLRHDIRARTHTPVPLPVPRTHRAQNMWSTHMNQSQSRIPVPREGNLLHRHKQVNNQHLHIHHDHHR